MNFEHIHHETELHYQDRDGNLNRVSKEEYLSDEEIDPYYVSIISLPLWKMLDIVNIDSLDSANTNDESEDDKSWRRSAAGINITEYPIYRITGVFLRFRMETSNIKFANNWFDKTLRTRVILSADVRPDATTWSCAGSVTINDEVTQKALYFLTFLVQEDSFVFDP